MVFVDTSAWFAYFLPTDPDHQQIRHCVSSIRERLVTTDYCVDETLTLVLIRREVRRALAAGRAFFEEFFEENVAHIYFLTPKQIQQAWIVFRQRMPSEWSFTDCTSKVVIDDLRIARAIALDHDFRQFGRVQVLP